MAADQTEPPQNRPGSTFFDEPAVSLSPPVRRTWSPRGQTPVLRRRYGWKAFMAAALGFRADGTAARLCFHLWQPSYDTETLIGILDQLGRFYQGQRVVLIWGRAKVTLEHLHAGLLDSQRDWITAERLPAYAPELNPVEYLVHTGLTPDP